MLLLITPGATEFIEDTVHYLAHGDTFHDEGHDAEHCCSGAFHFCGCHAEVPATPGPAAAAVVRVGATVPERAHGWPFHAVGPRDAHGRDLLRPPAA